MMARLAWRFRKRDVFHVVARRGKRLAAALRRRYPWTEHL